jgi:hypothetical protein
MRDPNRIPRVLEKLRIIWTLSGAQRLGQLLENLSGRYRTHERTSSGDHWRTIPPDLWDIYDEEWERLLDKRILELDGGIRLGNGDILFRDKDRMVTKDELYED